MPCRIYLRWDQSSSQRAKYSLPDRAKIFAPTWVRSALQKLGERLDGITFDVIDNPPTKAAQPLESYKITKDFNGGSLNLLQKIARNEPSNVTGEIYTGLYPDIKDKAVIYSIRDLVRQCVIAGVDESSSCGGYRCPREAQPKQRVYICDLAALQFQREYNTGRLILIQEGHHEIDKGILDEFIFEQVVGEPRRSYEDVLSMTYKDVMKRYIPHLHGVCFIDTYAYRRFVAADVILSGLALSEMAYKNGDKVNFKFLKYGTGFFAGIFQNELEKLILPGVLDGLEDLFGRRDPKVAATIKQVELPFFNEDPQSSERLLKLRTEHKICVIFTKDDALKRSKDNQLLVATTNCGDNHAVCGNEMRFSSVDAAIAENLESKGNIFSSNINVMIEEHYLDISAGEDANRPEPGSPPQCDNQTDSDHRKDLVDKTKDDIPCEPEVISDGGSERNSIDLTSESTKL